MNTQTEDSPSDRRTPPVPSEGLREMTDLLKTLGTPHLSGWRVGSTAWDPSRVLTRSLKELVGTLPSFGVCGWQGATLHKPAVLHSFGEILTHLQRTFCFTSYGLQDLRGDVNWRRPGKLRKLSLEHRWGLVLSWSQEKSRLNHRF